MAAKQISRRPMKLYVYGATNNKGLWYCIDLESLPESTDDEELFPVFRVNTFTGGWTFIGDHIYWTGKRDEAETFSTMALRRHNINTSPDPDPDPDPSDIVYDSERYLMYRSHLITLDGNRILVLGASRFRYNEDEDEFYDSHFIGEVYDLNTGICRNWAFNLQIFSDDFYSLHKTLLMDEQGKVKQLLFYCPRRGLLLFYHVSEDKFSLQRHRQFVLKDKLCDISRKSALYNVTMKVNAAVMDSTLYWFTHELYLYGYDFIRKIWFQSPPLEKEQLWQLPRDPLSYPFLVDVYNGEELVLLVQTACSKLGIAFLAVSKQGKSLHVIVKSRHTLSVDRTFHPQNGIAIPSAATLKTARKLKTPGPDADSVSSLDPANRTPKDWSSKVVCHCSPVIEMNREAQPVDISDENKGLSMHVEEMQSADREFELAHQLKKSESIFGDLFANLIDKEIQLKSLLEENGLLKLEMKNMELESTKSSNKALALVEEAKTAENETLIKPEILTEEADTSSSMVCVSEELNAAQVADSKIETEIKKLKVQCDQWRKAAETAVSLLSTGNNKKTYNMWKASMLSTGKNKKNNMWEKIGVLLEKGQK